MKGLIKAEQLTREKIEYLCNLADDIHENPRKYSQALAGKIIATIFYEPSTRTRLSFESAMLRLGAQVISTEDARGNSSVKKGELLTDTIRIVGGYADAIVIRHSDEDSAEVAASVSKVPIINAGSGKSEHPTQALLDIYTLKKCKGKLDGISVAFLGDLKYGRTSHSLIKLLALYENVTIYTLASEELALPQEYADYLKERGVRFMAARSFLDLPHDLDAFYQTRVQLERMDGTEENFHAYELTTESMREFSDDTIILHPLPRNDEISQELDDDVRAKFFEQAENGLYARMALLCDVLGE